MCMDINARYISFRTFRRSGIAVDTPVWFASIDPDSHYLFSAAGAGKVNKLAEIIGATVMAGEISLMSAVLAGDWVTSHDALGRNR